MDKKYCTRHGKLNITTPDEFAHSEALVSDGCKDVTFVRLIGVNRTYRDEIIKMDKFLFSKMNEGILNYERIDNLPSLRMPEDVDFYRNAAERWNNLGKSELNIKLTSGNESLREALSGACREVTDLFGKLTPHLNASIKQNFIAKILFWFDTSCRNIMKEWNFNRNIKIVLSNICGKQEYLFSYLLNLLGADILLLQSEADIDSSLKQLNKSEQVIYGSFSKNVIPPFDRGALTSEMKLHEAKQSRKDSAITQRTSAGTTGTARRSGTPGTAGSSETAATSRTPARSGAAATSGIPGTSGTAATSRTAARSGTSSSSGTVGRPERRELKLSVEGKRARSAERTEKTFEELALLAMSVVMIAIHNREGEVIGSGSGIMIGKDGYILTNNHVTMGGVFYSVRIEEDEEIYDTDELIKYNQLLDLAIIRIDKELTPIPIYDGKEKLVRGQKVVAIGSPLGLFNSVSNGIISGFRKMNEVDVIQFTAPISHGSSGGAVLNMFGEVIGISAAGIDSGQNLNLAVGFESIREFARGFIL